MTDDTRQHKWTFEPNLLIISVSVLVLVAAGAYAVSSWWHASQPQRYTAMLGSGSSYQRDQAVNYFTGLGPKALPHLIPMLNSTEEAQRMGAVYILRRMGFEDQVPKQLDLQFAVYLTRGNVAFDQNQIGRDGLDHGR